MLPPFGFTRSRGNAPKCKSDAGLLTQKVAAFESLDVSQYLRGKGFVNFPETDVGIRQAIAR